MKKLEEQGEIGNSIEERRNKVEKLHKEGKTQQEMAQILGYSKATIIKDIAYLKEQGRIIGRRQMQQKIQEERRKEIKKLIKDGKTQKEMAQQLKCSEMAISNEVKYLEEHGEVSDLIQERRKIVKELYKKGKTQKEIAQELKVSVSTISNDITYWKQQERMVSETQIMKLCEEFDGQEESLISFRIYITECKNRFRQGKLQKEEISTIERITERTKSYGDIIFCLKIELRYRQFKRAMQFANYQMNNETLTEEQKDNIRKLKQQIQKANDTYIATRELKKGGKIQQAVLLETER